MGDKYHSDTQEKVETIYYNPTAQDSGDLVEGTKTITATTEASGIGNADYSKVLTLAKPDDARLVVKRIAARLAVTIDSMTAGHLYCRVYVDAQDDSHRLFDEDWTTAGAQLGTSNLSNGTIFNLLTDGVVHTFYFFFWVDSGNAVISLVQLQEAVGKCSVGPYAKVLRINHGGLITLVCRTQRFGSGNPYVGLLPSGGAWFTYANVSGHTAVLQCPIAAICNDDGLGVMGSVATDLAYVDNIHVNLRSMQ